MRLFSPFVFLLGTSQVLLASILSVVGWLPLLSITTAKAETGAGDTSTESLPILSTDLGNLFRGSRENTNTDDATSSAAAAGASNSADLTNENESLSSSNAELPAVNSAAVTKSTIQSRSTYEQLLDAAIVASKSYLPFRFKHIFVIGGDHEDPTSWTSRFSRPCVETLDLPEENYIRAKTFDEAATRDFHLQALKQVEERVGDELTETLVITAGLGLEEDWTPVADLLRRGMAFFHGGYTGDTAGITMDLAQFNLTQGDVLYFYFRLDEASAARRAGREVCRLKGGRQQTKIAKIRWDARPDLHFRVDIAIQAFTEACPETEVVELWTVDWDDSEQTWKNALLVNPLPDIVFSCFDLAAEKLLDIAKTALPADEYYRISTTGWDNLVPHYLQQRKILTTVDQLVFHPHRGIWNLMDTLIQSIQESGIRSTRAVQDQLRIGENAIITSETLTISSDKAGFLVNSLMYGYAPESPPSDEVQVSTGLKDLSITKMLAFEGKFQTVLWLLISWDDQRLAWNPLFYQGQLQIDPSRIWTPSHYFENAFEQNDLYQAPAIITSDGKVFLEINIQSEFLCSTSAGLQKFPFDKYDCSIDLALTDRAEGIVLDSNLGFTVIETDQHFHTTTSIAGENVTKDDDGEQGEETSRTPEDTPGIHYQIQFERLHYTAYVRLILPSIMINMVGFMAFWVDGKQESISLGITSLLCCLAFRQTVEMPDTSDATWTEIFMMVNIMAQASVMFIIWASFGSARTARGITSFCVIMDPRRIQKRMMNVLKRPPWNTSGGGVETSIPIGGTVNITEISIDSSLDRGTKTTRQRRRDVSSDGPGACGITDPETASDGYHEDLEEEKRKVKIDKHPSVDWVGRRFVAPGYVVILLTMIFRGVGIF